MRIKTINNAPSDNQLSNHSGFKFPKKVLLIIAVAAVAVIVAALLIPPGAAAIPLNVNYNVGEKMVYTTTESLSMKAVNSTLPGTEGFPMNNNLTFSGTEIIEVLSFDGQIYKLNNTSTITEAGRPFSTSNLEEMNKTGYTTTIVNLGNTSEEISGGSPTNDQYLAQLLSKPEVKVGDSVTIPYPALPGNLSSSMQTTGDLTLTFKGYKELAVPAGTYKVFEIDLTSNNLAMTINTSSITGNSKVAVPVEPSNITMNMNLSYQMYFEYNTMRQIQSSMQETSTFQSTTLSYTTTNSMDMTLNQDITP